MIFAASDGQARWSGIQLLATKTRPKHLRQQISWIAKNARVKARTQFRFGAINASRLFLSISLCSVLDAFSSHLPSCSFVTYHPTGLLQSMSELL